MSYATYDQTRKVGTFFVVQERGMVTADIGSFTPVPHTLAQEVGLVCAAVYGAVWRYCQMEEGAAGRH